MGSEQGCDFDSKEAKRLQPNDKSMYISCDTIRSNTWECFFYVYSTWFGCVLLRIVSQDIYMDLSLGCNRFASLNQNRNPVRSPCGLDPEVNLIGKYGCTINQRNPRVAVEQTGQPLLH